MLSASRPGATADARDFQFGVAPELNTRHSVPLDHPDLRHPVVVEALSSGAILLVISIGLWFAYDHEKTPPEQRHTYQWVFVESRRWVSVVAKRVGIPLAAVLMLAGLVQLAIQA